ncbi:translation initiation factor IF-2-like [Amphibalanus amphitrite]|uniref:translation initiation factor IF-2-like n=1 Tax=Amphibalanus amphitrite TaxID=1232801 RepID=UPI001C907082|nr:translation initiation factor IF-2-like [Amphibalanus amphitrite]
MECQTEVRGQCQPPVPVETGSAATDYDQERPLMDSPPRPRAHSRRQRRRVLSNPLLDTISAIEDDDSDELGLPERKGADGETYTAGYVGGSSIDSGYKSSCPTPEMVDIAYYTTTLSPAEQAKRLSVASQTSQDSASSLPGSLGVAQKPRIAMGTKVMSRQAASASSVEQPRRRHDSGFSDATLCHLTVVRDNLLRMERRSREPSAAAPPPRPEARGQGVPAVRPRSASMGSVSAVSPRPLRRSGSPVPPPRAAPRAAVPAPAAAPGRPASPPPPSVHPRRRSPSPGAPRPPARPELTAACRRPRPPPARPAPRDAAVRPAVAERAQRGTREEDIDGLMYGRRAAPHSTDLLAPSRRADVLMPRGPVGARVGVPHEPVGPASDGLSARPTAGRPVHGIRSKFSHMAQCMLDIIDELHSKGRVQRPADSPSPTPSDYHTYEEVMYGLIGRERIAEAAPSPEPPPLPLRPSVLFSSAREVAPAVPVLPPPTDCAPRRPDAPKQRNNLYSLFSSARERRSLSHNLEQEVAGAGSDGDEYGFAVRK